LKLCLGRGLEAQRQAGGDENDGFTSLSQRLIEQPLGIPEGARQRLIRNNSITHLIRDENHRTAEPGDALRQLARRGREIGLLQEKIAEPQRQAIGNDNAIRPGLPPECSGQRDRFFHQRPARIPCGGMTGDALGHLAIARLRRRDQDGMPPRGFCETLRVAAFARPSAAEDEQAFCQGAARVMCATDAPANR